MQKGVQRHPASISRDILPRRVGDILPSRGRDILPPVPLPHRLAGSPQMGSTKETISYAIERIITNTASRRT